MTTDPTDTVNVDFWADRIAALIKLAEHNGMTVQITGGELAVSRQVSDVFVAQTEVQWRADPAAPAVPAGRDALRDRIAAAVSGAAWSPPGSELVQSCADAVLAVLSPPADRAAVLREGEAALREKAGQLSELAEETMRRDLEEIAQVWHEAASALAQLATEQPAVVAAVAGEASDAETLNAQELAHAIDNSTPYPVELDSALCRHMAERLLEMTSVHKRPEHAVWQPEEPPGPSPEPMDPSTLATDEDRLRCPRCREDITDYAEDDHVFRTGDDRPYCSGECVVAAHRAAASQPGKEG